MKSRSTPPSPRRPLLLIAIALAALLLLAACGQRGPLYLPDEPSSGQPDESRDQDDAEDGDGSTPSPGID